MSNLDPKIFKKNDLLLSKKAENYALFCSAFFKPENKNIPKYLKNGGYDYIAREKQCTVILKIQNICSASFPGINNLVVNVVDSTSIVKYSRRFNSSEGLIIPKLEPGGDHELHVRLNGRVLDGDIQLQALVKDKSFASEKIIFSNDQYLSKGILEPANIWGDRFYILSLEKELELTLQNNTLALSRRAIFISLAALGVNIFRVVVNWFSGSNLKEVYEVTINKIKK